MRLLNSIAASRILEVGCGAGALLDELSLNGHECTGLETSRRAVELARAIASMTGGTQVITAHPLADWNARFDLVCAFDVLEHIFDDARALSEWLGWLRPQGHICISVPAHRSRWGAGDEWAGHYRRYDKKDLVDLLASCELRIEHFECYGFPLANATEWLGSRAYTRLMKERERTVTNAEASEESGIERSDYLRHFRMMDTWPGRMALRANFLLQSLTARTDLGSGYLVLARKA